MLPTDWKRAFETPDSLLNLDGQFAGFKYSRNELLLFTDPLGQRDMYYTHANGATLFSTRPDWLAILTGNRNIDIQEFGARWLFFYQLSNRSILENIERLGPGAVVRITANRRTTHAQSWLPRPTVQQFEFSLESLTTFAASAGKRVSLGLSGGLDSRLLFALLLQHKVEWDVFTFGPEAHPDVIIAKDIAQSFGVPHRHYHHEDPLSASNLEERLIEYCSQSLALRPASSFLQLQHYPQLYAKDTVVIDGSFGEIARRQMLNRIAIRGRRALREKRADRIFNMLHRSRADIFSDAASAIMRAGAMHQIEELWQTMPDPTALGIGNWLDLLVIRSGLPNVNAAEQARIDHFVPSYMPFVQPSLLDTIFQMAAAQRRGGRMFRKIIEQREPELTRFPLCAVDCMVPYRFTTVPAFMLRKLKTLTGNVYHDYTRDRFLHRVQPLVQELSRSIEVRNDALFDKTKVRSLIDAYYSGQRERGAELDWWLGLALWRRSLL